MKIPDTSRLVKKPSYNTKIIKIESKIPSIPGLASTTDFSAVENKIPNFSDLIKKKKDL